MRWSSSARPTPLLPLLLSNVSGASFQVFRFVWGLIVAYEFWVLISSGDSIDVLSGDYFHFRYWKLAVPIVPNHYLLALAHFGLTCALLLAIGIAHSFTCLSVLCVFVYFFLIDASLYLNHFYLVILVTFVMLFVPAQPMWNYIRAPKPIARFHIWTFRALIFIVYFFAATAKLNEDWLRAQPLRGWLLKRASRSPNGFTSRYLLGRLWAAYFFSVGGIVFDLGGSQLLLWSFGSFSATRVCARVVAVIAAVLFHGINKLVFDIGIFPAMMLALSTLLLPHCWPEHFLLRGADIRKKARYAQQPRASFQTYIILALMALFLLVNVLLPLRHLFYPGNVSWTEYGHRFSWRMKLREKQCDGRFLLHTLDTNVTVPVQHRYWLSGKQTRKMMARPELIVQFAHMVHHYFLRTHGKRSFEIRAEIFCSLNNRPRQLFLDPHTNLAAQDPWQWPFDFVLPLRPLSISDLEDLIWNKVWLRPEELVRPLNREMDSANRKSFD